MEMGINMDKWLLSLIKILKCHPEIFRDRFKDLHRKTMAAVAGADFFLALRVGHGSPVSSQMRPVSISTTSLSPATISRLIRIAWQWSAQSWQWKTIHIHSYMVGWLGAPSFFLVSIEKINPKNIPNSKEAASVDPKQ